jgi:holin-like protein
MKNALYSLLSLYLSLLLGKGLYASVGGLPGSLYGMIIFSLLLHFKLLDAARVGKSIQWIIQHMGVFYVPAGVGIINHFELIKTHGLVLVGIIFFTTFLLMTLVGLTFDKFSKESKVILKQDLQGDKNAN